VAIIKELALEHRIAKLKSVIFYPSFEGFPQAEDQNGKELTGSADFRSDRGEIDQATRIVAVAECIHSSSFSRWARRHIAGRCGDINFTRVVHAPRLFQEPQAYHMGK